MYYPTEFLNCLNPSGISPHRLVLKIGSPVIMLRNLNPNEGLCNGTMLICRQFSPHIIHAEIVNGSDAGRHVFIPRIELMPSDTSYPFTLRRRQFLVRLCYCMIINKAQSQILDFVGLYRPDHVFSHGQVYVGLSRVGSANSMKVFAPTSSVPSGLDGSVTRNI